MSKKHDCDIPNCTTKDVPAKQTMSFPEDWRKMTISFQSAKTFNSTSVVFEVCPTCAAKIDAQLGIEASAPEKQTDADVLFSAMQGMIEEQVQAAMENQ